MMRERDASAALVGTSESEGAASGMLRNSAERKVSEKTNGT
jgi:hypothetical protein